MARARDAADVSDGWSVGVDIGGTFTDIVAINDALDVRVDGKVLTTPSDPLVGVFNAIQLVAEQHRLQVADCQYLVHATTLASNTLIERTGAQVGMLTTTGFRDVTEAGRADRYDLFDLQIDLPEPLVPRDRRLAVDERMNARGEVVTPLDTDGVRQALIDMGPVDAVVICFLHSYANDSHETQAAEMVGKLLPGVYVSTSSDVAPIIREYERFIATTINAYVGPRVAAYIAGLEDSLRKRKFAGIIGIMKSDGGMCAPAEAARHPVQVLESGPTAGILSAAYTARQCDEPLALAFDMGGTTAKACVVFGGEPARTHESDIARLKRFAKGSGFPLRVPTVDLIEIGAGGGSIAWTDALGILQVGPQSSGAEPGPACYGIGGTKPTVTDADLLLGYLDPTYFAGGTMQLDASRSERAVADEILVRTGTTDVTLAAWAIHDIVNENMVRASRLHCLEHGVDPGKVTIVATGGAGPVHAGWLLEKLNAAQVICPPSAAVASAFGLLLAPRTLEASNTSVRPMDEVTDDEFRSRLGEIEDRLRAAHADEEFTSSAWVQMRLIGQGYELPIDVPEERTVSSLAFAFDREYTARYGRPPWSGKREIIAWGVRLKRDRHVESTSGTLATVPVGAPRKAYFGPSYGWMTTPVFNHESLKAALKVSGPLFVAEQGTTIVVTPGQQAYCDDWNNVHIEPLPAERRPATAGAGQAQEVSR